MRREITVFKRILRITHILDTVNGPSSLSMVTFSTSVVSLMVFASREGSKMAFLKCIALAIVVIKAFWILVVRDFRIVKRHVVRNLPGSSAYCVIRTTGPIFGMY